MMLGLRSPEEEAVQGLYGQCCVRASAPTVEQIKATYPAVAEPDPFKHEGIMKLDEERSGKIIATAAGKEEPARWHWASKLEVDSYDATGNMQVQTTIARLLLT